MWLFLALIQTGILHACAKANGWRNFTEYEYDDYNDVPDSVNEPGIYKSICIDNIGCAIF